MNKHARLGWTAFSAQICAGFALAAMLAMGCSDGGGGSGGSTSSGGNGGTNATGGTGGTTTGGTGGASAATCESVMPNRFSVRMALHEEGQPPVLPDNVGPPVTTSMSGTVTAAASGPLPEECDYIPVGSAGAWLTFSDADGKNWNLCYTGTNAFWPVQVGDAIDLELTIAPGYLAGFSYELTLRKAGALMLLALEDNSGMLTPPSEITVGNGEEVCVTEGDFTCTEHGFKAAASSADGDQAEILPGETGIVGGFQVHVGEWSDVHDGGGCEAGPKLHHLFAVPAP